MKIDLLAIHMHAHIRTRNYTQDSQLFRLITLGKNITFRGVLSFEAGSLECFAGTTEVVGASMWFSKDEGTDSFSYDFEVDEVTINHLIVGHPVSYTHLTLPTNREV